MAKLSLLAAIRLAVFLFFYMEAVKTGEWVREMLMSVDGEFVKMYVRTSEIRRSSLLHPC
jgi:hypothetical protein